MALRPLSSAFIQNLSAPSANASHITGMLCAAAALYNNKSASSLEISSSSKIQHYIIIFSYIPNEHFKHFLIILILQS